MSLKTRRRKMTRERHRDTARGLVRIPCTLWKRVMGVCNRMAAERLIRESAFVRALVNEMAGARADMKHDRATVQQRLSLGRGPMG